VLDSVPLTLVGVLEVPQHHDHTTWSWHLQLEVGVVQDNHELGVARPPEYGDVGYLEVDNFKGECLLSVVYHVIECHREVYRA
jgi:hypothetical protein